MEQEQQDASSTRKRPWGWKKNTTFLLNILTKAIKAMSQTQLLDRNNKNEIIATFSLLTSILICIVKISHCWLRLQWAVLD
jgi:hypothetical protein